MSQSMSDRWTVYLLKLLQRSPLALVGWCLVALPSQAVTLATNSSVGSSSSTTPAISIASTFPLSSAAALSESRISSELGQLSQAPRVLAQAIAPAADGTGTVVTQTGNSFEITGGTQAGANLFHSFQQFGLSADQAATILSSPDIANILGRVVGGEASFINGSLQVTGGNSNLFLINPAGIIFGPDASAVLPAAFTVTTADAVSIGDYWFEAIGTPNYANLIGAPTGFAFTTDNPGMVINAGSLTAAPESVVTLLGGFVLNTGSIETPGGTINIATVPGENLVRITPEGSLLSLELPINAPDENTDFDVLTVNDLPTLLAGEVATEELGVVIEGDTVRLVANDTEIPNDAGTTIVAGSLDTSETSLEGMGGEIDVLGDQVALIDADLDASGASGGGTILIGGDYQGQGEVPNADFTYVDSTATIKADALAAGDGGTVIVWADDTTQFFGDISARGGSESGDGGLVEVSGQQNLGFNGTVDVVGEQGNDGQVLLDPTNILIANEASTDGVEGALPTIEEDGGIFDGNDIVINATALTGLAGDILLEATNDIEVADGISLNFDLATDSITFIADSDGVDGGDFRMDVTQSINTNGANLKISGNQISVGEITTFSNPLAVNEVKDAASGNLEIRSELDTVIGDINTYVTAKVDNLLFDFLIGVADPDPIDINQLDFGTVEVDSISGSILSSNQSEPSSIIAFGDITLSAANDVIVGNLDSVANDIVNFSSSFTGGQLPTSISVSTNVGDVQVGYVRAGASGISIEAGRSFRSLSFLEFDGGSAVNYEGLIQFLESFGYEREALLEGEHTLLDAYFPISLIAIPRESIEGEFNAPITIKYGSQDIEIINREFEVDFATKSRILVLGDSTQVFTSGPTYIEEITYLFEDADFNSVPFDKNTADFEPDEFSLFTSPNLTVENSQPVNIPEGASGTVAGITVGPLLNTTLYGATQSTLFTPSVEPTPVAEVTAPMPSVELRPTAMPIAEVTSVSNASLETQSLEVIVAEDICDQKLSDQDSPLILDLEDLSSVDELPDQAETNSLCGPQSDLRRDE